MAREEEESAGTLRSGTWLEIMVEIGCSDIALDEPAMACAASRTQAAAKQ